MPVQYDCKRCELTFTVGGYHGFDFYGDYGGGFCLVCYGCGLGYHIEHANRDRGPEYFEVYGIRVKSYSSRAKVLLLKKVREWTGASLQEAKNMVISLPFEKEFPGIEVEGLIEELLDLGIVSEKYIVSKQSNIHFGKPLAKDILTCNSNIHFCNREDVIDKQVVNHGERRGECQEIDLSKLECIKCHSVGKISGELPVNNMTCPNCKNDTLFENGGFVT